MTRWLLKLLPSTLLLLLLCSTGCTRTTLVPVLVPRTPCPLQPVPPFPDLHAEVCGPRVCLAADRAAAIYTWVRSAERAVEMANVCLSDADTPPAKGLEAPIAVIGVDQIVKDMSFGGRIKVTVRYEDCGEPNALYYPTHDLVICNELMVQLPEMVPFAAAHEMGHAIIDQMHLPTTGSEEVAADEMASVYLLTHDRYEDVKAAALHFGDDAMDYMFYDPHPDGARRNFTLRCLAEGSIGNPQYGCDTQWLRTAVVWVRLLTGALRG